MNWDLRRSTIAASKTSLFLSAGNFVMVNCTGAPHHSPLCGGSISLVGSTSDHRRTNVVVGPSEQGRWR
jgi:hypothetical protein